MEIPSMEYKYGYESRCSVCGEVRRVFSNKMSGMSIKLPLGWVRALGKLFCSECYNNTYYTITTIIEGRTNE
jgi:hypothetical protein